MLFSTPIFLFAFLPILLGSYYLSPQRTRNVLLLMASLFFYTWGELALVVVMIASTSLNYAFGLWVDHCRGEARGRFVLGLALAMNLSILGYFKYAQFLIENLNGLLALWGDYELVWPDVRLPIGISFYTFQAMSYVIDVYHGTTPVERNPIRVALYIALFPQLIAGPIVRYFDVAAQLREREVSLDGIARGIERFVVGLGKKMLIANSAAAVADSIFAIPSGHLSCDVAWLGLVCFTLQIYFDFSGYSDMAIGLGRMFGFRFLENFDYPYIARSVTEFWRRWHISLSRWFRDYLYIPLGGNRRSPARVALNLMLVFFLCGLWHGASWNFVIWGLFHGTFLIIERRGFSAVLERVWRPLAHLYVLLIVMSGWLLFRAETWQDAVVYSKVLLGLRAAVDLQYPLEMYLNPSLCLVLAVGCLGSLPIVPALARRTAALVESNRSSAQSVAIESLFAVGRLGSLGIVLVTSAAMMMADTYNPFIYFRF